MAYLGSLSGNLSHNSYTSYAVSDRHETSLAHKGPEGTRENIWSIGWWCKCSNVLSQPVLINRAA